jgi:hypothetical protein
MMGRKGWPVEWMPADGMRAAADRDFGTSIGAALRYPTLPFCEKEVIERGGTAVEDMRRRGMASPDEWDAA